LRANKENYIHQSNLVSRKYKVIWKWVRCSFYSEF